MLVVLGVARAAGADESARTPGKPDPEIGRCVKRVRDDQRACMRAATERCRATFEADLPGCYGTGAACPRACIDEQAKCRADPQVNQEGCRLACGSDQKVAMQRCRVEPDRKGCEGDVKVRALTCKQKCVADAAPALQRCMRRFDDCLTTCSKAPPPGQP